MSTRRRTLWSALVGVIAAVATLTVADLVAQFVATPSSPLFAVGAFVIDIVPPWVKDTAIALFGTGDKIALLVALGLLVAILAVLIGLLEYRKPGWGVVALALVGVIAGAAAASRAGATIMWAVPTAIGVVAGAFALRILTDRLRVWADAGSSSTSGMSRRGFLTVVGVTAAGAVVATLAAQAMRAATSAANVVREAIALPAPAVAATAMPAGAELSIRGLAPVITPNDSFYRIDTALQVPIIDAEQWTLKITGLVEREVEIDYRELLARDLIETTATLSCVSNEVGGNLIGNAVWLGLPIRELLAKAVPLEGADMVLSTSHDGFTASTPLDVLVDEGRDAILAVAMNGEPLPLAHGFPVRMVVPGLYGYVSATKWVTELKVTTFEQDFAYWTVRGWSEHGPVKLSSRIDVPRTGATLAPGTVAVAGLAWAPHTGVAGVEVRVDGGSWQPARLADEISSDTWRQWVYSWNATSGNHTLEVRATDAADFTQSGVPVSVVPNGAEGWHTISVTVS